MKNTIIILILFIVCISPVSAPEITGSISTNPNNLELSVDEAERDLDLETPRASVYQLKPSVLVPEDKLNEDEILVLGFSEFADGSLLRSSDNKIYLVEGDYKKHIKSLGELKKYSGKIIFDVDDKTLSKYKTRSYSNGDLIRAIGEVKIFHIVDGELNYVLNLEELRVNFAGQEIFNINKEEMLLYL